MRPAEPTTPGAVPSVGLCWRDDLSSAQWDEALAALEGHPLQSAAWGDARREFDRIEDVRLAAFVDGQPVLLARVEVRSVLGPWRVGWVPSGPTAAAHPRLLGIAAELRDRCRRVGCSLLVVDPYLSHAACIGELGRPVGLPIRTICLDLTAGRDQILANLDRQWRYNMNLAGRKGVVVEQTENDEDVGTFFLLCRRAGEMKRFQLGEPFEFMRHLVTASHDGPVRWRLFVARCSGRVVGGGLVAVSGHTMHQVWSALDRDFRQAKPTEALRWNEIEWALAEGLETYDLGGIEPKQNPGTYEFKRRMGGSEVTLPGKFAIPFSTIGRAGAWALDRALRV